MTASKLPKTMEFNVTQRDIDRAVESRKEKCAYRPSQSCPIAVSGRRKLKGRFSGAGLEVITLTRTSRYYDLPSQACKFVEDFDNRRKVSPIKFIATLSK